MDEGIIRITFTKYFGTPLTFLFLLITSLMEGYIATRLLNNNSNNKRIIIAVIIGNFASYFSEYFLSILLNGGHILLVWIPWVKIVGTTDLFNYIISFPLIFIVTLIIEAAINWLILKNTFTLSKIFKASLYTNLISLINLIITFNCIVFNYINGEEFGPFIIPDDSLPEPNLKKS